MPKPNCFPNLKTKSSPSNRPFKYWKLPGMLSLPPKKCPDFAWRVNILVLTIHTQTAPDSPAETERRTKGRNWETEKEGGEALPYPLSAVPPESPHRQLEHQPAGPPRCHRSLDHHGALHGVCLRGCVDMCVWGGRPLCPVQPGSRHSHKLVCTCSPRFGGVQRKRKKVCAVEVWVCVCVEIVQQHTLLRVSLHLYFPSCWNSFHSSSLSSRSTKLLVSVWEGEGACFVSPLSSPLWNWRLPPPPSLPHSLTSVGGLTRSLD